MIQNNNYMKAIKINYSKTNEDLTGKSKMWGQADLPESMDYPLIPYDDGEDDPMTMVCQIRCSDLAKIDPENLLPHEGMLYFFADIDEYVHALYKELDEDEEFEDEEDFTDEEDDETEVDYRSNGMGEWDPEAFRVLYSPTEVGLQTHSIIGPDGEPYGLPAEKITFETGGSSDELVTKLLGKPYDPEVQYWYPDYINLFQLCEEDDWGLMMYDCGILNFLITPEDLKARRWDRIIVHLHSL